MASEGAAWHFPCPGSELRANQHYQPRYFAIEQRTGFGIANEIENVRGPLGPELGREPGHTVPEPMLGLEARTAENGPESETHHVVVVVVVVVVVTERVNWLADSQAWIVVLPLNFQKG